MADGELHDFVTGKCETCDSIQLINPTTFAVDRMKALVKAADIAEKAVANG